MKYSWGIFFVFVFCGASSLVAQDTSNLSVNAYVDAYYSYDFNEPVNSNQPHLVSAARHNDFSINLAMLDMRYQSKRIRGRFATGVGSYMNANYAAETGSFRNIVNATVGVKLSKKKEVWVDAGIMGAPFSYEGAISKNQLLYSRSLAAEGSPYYVTGVKLTAPLAKNLKGAVYIVNGWQQITDVNNQKSVIGHLLFSPKNINVNLSAYYGNEQNIVTTNYRERFLADFNIVIKENEKMPFNISIGGYYGNQKVEFTGNREGYFEWFQANVAANYLFKNGLGIAGRVEYFNDANAIIYNPVIGSSFKVTSLTMGGSYQINPNALFRVEARSFLGERSIYIDADGGASRASTILWASLAINFGHTFQLVKSRLSSTN